ncbi:aerobic cobaltochelatase subunit [Pseudomonas phage hairong]|nr:aerobic cobaltochelatase subunit [Pseudomonas phage hairong]
MDRTKRIAIVRESIIKIAQILSDNKVLVTQAGVKAFVKYDERTHKATRVNLPMIPDDASEELIDSVQGFLDSEIAKVLYADGKSNLRATHENMAGLYNPLESFFCEKKMVENFAGSRHNLANMHQTFVDKFIEPKLKEALANGAEEQELFQCLAIPALRAWGGQQFFIDYMSDKWSLIAGIQKQLDPIASKMAGMTKPEDCYEMAKEIRNVVMGEPPEGDGDNPFGEEDPTKGGGGGSGGGKGSGKGKGGAGSKSGKGDAGALDDDEEKEDPSAGGPPGEEEEEEDDEAEEEGSDDDGEAEEKDDGEGDDEDESPAPEPEDEGAGGSSADSRTKQSETPPATEDTASGQQDYGGASYMKDFDWDKIQDIGDEFGQYVTDLCSSEMEAEDYTIFTREWDQLDPPQVPKGFKVEWVDRMEEQIQGMVGPVSRNLERAFAARNKSLTQQGLRKGKLSSNNLYRLVAGDDHIYKGKIEHKTRDIAVSLVIDCSGSMHGSKINTAMCSAWVMADVLQRLGVDCEIMGFTTGDLSSSHSRELYEELREEYNKGRSWDRTEPIRMPLFKSFREKFSNTIKARMASYAHVQGGMSGNIDGESVQYAYESLNRHARKGKPKGRMMIVFSDGQPAAGVDGRKLNAHLKSTVSRIEADGVNIVGVGIMSDAVQRFYRKNVKLDNVEELPGIVLKELRDALLAS